MSQQLARKWSSKSIEEFNPPPPKFKIPITVAVYFCYFAFGLSASIVGPALFDIADATGSGFSQVSNGYIGRNAAYCVAALLCCYLLGRINRQIAFIIALTISGFSVLVVPFIHRLALYLLAESVYGFFTAFIDVACNAWVLEIWDQGSNPYMQGLHFFYSIGMTVAPLMTAPFLSIHPMKNLTTFGAPEDENTILKGRESHIEVPYSIGAAMLFASAIALLVLQFTMPYKDPKRTVAPMNNNGTPMQEQGSQEISLIESQADKRYSYAVILLGSLILCFYSGVESTTITFFPKFVTSTELQLTKSTGAFMTSVLAGSYAVCRGISIFLATKIKPHIMVYAALVLLSTGNLLLLCFANNSQPMLWLSLVILGIGHSCVIPSIYSMCEERINVSNFACSCFIFSSCANVIVTPAILTAFIDKNALVLVYMNAFGLAVCFALLAALHVIDRNRAKAKDLVNSGNSFL